MKKTILALAIMLCGSFGFAGTIDPTVADSEYLEFGKKFDCVKQIEVDYETKEKGKTLVGCASCVVIGDNWVLTSAHILLGKAECVYVVHDGHRHVVDRMYVHKNFDFDLKSVQNVDQPFADLALCHVRGKPEFEFKASIVDVNVVNVIGKVVAISGFGATGTLESGATNFDRKRRAGSNIIDGIEKDILLASSKKNENRKTTLEMLVATGDSGGGVFVDGKLLGIISFIRSTDGTNSNYGDSSGFLDLRQYKRWINDIIEKR